MGKINCSECVKLLVEIEQLREDKARIDWLADTSNSIGNVQLPTECVLRNTHSLRDAIDDARRGA